MKTPSILVVDNYDSFTFNLVFFLRKSGCPVRVWRQDAFPTKDAGQFSHLVFSPGPGIPSESKGMMAVLERFYQEKPILGVCLGHQAMGEFFGGTLRNLTRVFHGVATAIRPDPADPLFLGLPDEITVGRYHSWVVDPTPEFDRNCQVTARDAEGSVMAFRHRQFPLFGLQFHPESILSPEGPRILENWLQATGV